MKKMKILVLLAMLLTAGAAKTMAQTVGAVSIADDRSAPYQSAMLDIMSDDKGMLIPRMTHAQMNAISPVHDGLTVFVDDAPNRGIWYYDQPQTQWVKLAILPNGQKMIAPMGGVIMYSGMFTDFYPPGHALAGLGKPGTQMEGWAVCNGLNGTPDLRGKFVVGASAAADEYDHLAGQGGAPTAKMEEENMPRHTHPVDPTKSNNITAPHDHPVLDPGHSHEIATTKSIIAGVNHVRRRGPKDTQHLNSTGPLPMTGKLNIPTGQTEENAGYMSWAIPADLMKPTGDGKEWENRPIYFTVAYIMRTDGTTNYNVAPTFPY